MQAVLNNAFAPPGQRAAAMRALTVPDLPFAWAPLFADFLRLDGRRPPSMGGASAIPIAEIEALGRVLHGGYVPHEVETLLDLDAIRLRVAVEPIDDAVRALTSEAD